MDGINHSNHNSSQGEKEGHELDFTRGQEKEKDMAAKRKIWAAKRKTWTAKRRKHATKSILKRRHVAMSVQDNNQVIWMDLDH